MTNPDGSIHHYDNLRDFYREYEQLRSLMINHMDRNGQTYGMAVTELAKYRNGQIRQDQI